MLRYPYSGSLLVGILQVRVGEREGKRNASKAGKVAALESQNGRELLSSGI